MLQSLKLGSEERLEELPMLPSFREALIGQELTGPWQRINTFLRQETQKQKVMFPPKHLLFSAFNRTQLRQIKVVIIGQDPYHGLHQAHGLAFSVAPNIPAPPSLMNIFKELSADLSYRVPSKNHCLLPLADQGVLLLNTTLSVEQGKPLSHRGQGWEEITSALIQTMNKELEHVVFILWGKHAGGFRELIQSSQHHIISSSHPSPFSASRGFFGSKPFSRANHYLQSKNRTPVDWSVVCPK